MRHIILATLVFLSGLASSAFAADGGQGEGSFLVVLFIGFFALIVVFQLVPAAILFIGMLKGLFSSEQKIEKPLN